MFAVSWIKLLPPLKSVPSILLVFFSDGTLTFVSLFILAWQLATKRNRP